MQRAGKWRQRGKETLAVHEVGEVTAMVRSLHELEWREEKGEERRGGSLDEEACERSCPKRRKRRGSGTGARARVESR